MVVHRPVTSASTVNGTSLPSSHDSRSWYLPAASACRTLASVWKLVGNSRNDFALQWCGGQACSEDAAPTVLSCRVGRRPRWGHTESGSGMETGPRAQPPPHLGTKCGSRIPPFRSKRVVHPSTRASTVTFHSFSASGRVSSGQTQPPLLPPSNAARRMDAVRLCHRERLPRDAFKPTVARIDAKLAPGRVSQLGNPGPRRFASAPLPLKTVSHDVAFESSYVRQAS